ncbi:uncharacterized protein LOC128552752 [Mercenaria mercenaria]|uniref:uncharacterized protein LOC128552752 n=1 Tax=Mercenaria mercenaria TaxID=6596 RepID=UPI00234E3807|nr:uncharacterized protein LOC128552752 [Mercenaria mercenaria]
MKVTVYINVLILLGGIKTVVLGADDFTVEVSETCYNDNDAVQLVVQYTGSGSPTALRWKFSKMTDATATLDISITFCLASAGADPAFPEARMSYSCDAANKQYNVTISSFDELTDAGLWEAALSVSGSYSDFKNVTVTKCTREYCPFI